MPWQCGILSLAAGSLLVPDHGQELSENEWQELYMKLKDFIAQHPEPTPHHPTWAGDTAAAGTLAFLKASCPGSLFFALCRSDLRL